MRRVKWINFVLIGVELSIRVLCNVLWHPDFRSVPVVWKIAWKLTVGVYRNGR